MNINLHNIFRSLVRNDEFLLTVHEIRKVKSNKPAVGIMDIMTGPVLAPGERQAFVDLPEITCSARSSTKPSSGHAGKRPGMERIMEEQEDRDEFSLMISVFLGKGHERLGVKTTREKNFETVRCSFLYSLHIIIRPDFYSMPTVDQEYDHDLFESFLFNTLERNYRIDKIKNTKKIKAVNQNMIQEVRNDSLHHETIRTVINIFEVNLILFDNSVGEIMLYWTSGTKYPFFNFFKPIVYMIRSGDHYEPIVDLRKKDPSHSFGKGYLRRLYKKLFENLHMVKPYPPIAFGIESLIYPSQWRDTSVFETALPLVHLPEPASF